MRPSRRTALAAALVALALAAPATATAAPADKGGGPNPRHTVEEYLATLTPEEAAEFTRTTLPASVVQTESVVPANAAAVLVERGAVLPMAISACWTQRQTVTAKAAAGNTLYSGYHVGGWCMDGKSVVQPSTKEYGGQTFTMGWRYAGRVGGGAAVVLNEGRSYSQFKFVLGVNGWDIQTSLPCARVRGLLKGASYTDMVCGLR